MFVKKLSSNFKEDIRRSLKRQPSMVYSIHCIPIRSMFVSSKIQIQVYNINIVLISCFYRNIFRCTKYCNNFEIEFNFNFFWCSKTNAVFVCDFAVVLKKNVCLNKSNTERFFVGIKTYKSSCTQRVYSLWPHIDAAHVFSLTDLSSLPSSSSLYNVPIWIYSAANYFSLQHWCTKNWENPKQNQCSCSKRKWIIKLFGFALTNNAKMIVEKSKQFFLAPKRW